MDFKPAGVKEKRGEAEIPRPSLFLKKAGPFVSTFLLLELSRMIFF